MTSKTDNFERPADDQGQASSDATGRSDFIRINKFLSQCGVTSRRGAEKLIAEGKVVVNGQTLDTPGFLVDPTQDEVKVNGTLVKPVATKLYVLLNKPRMVMTTLHDPFRRRTVNHLLKQLPERVFPVGRLDYDTRGVLLLTNDGDLAYRLTHPKYEIPKVYQARVTGLFQQKAADQIERGIRLKDGATGRARVKYVVHKGSETVVTMVLTEGRKREVKELCQAVGHPVLTLERTEFANVTCGSLKAGQWRYLTADEVESLHKLVGIDKPSANT